MSGISSSLRKFLARRTGRRPAAGARFSRPAVEALEARDVPTVVFTPVMGAENVSSNGGYLLHDTNVYLLFWGSYWQNEGHSLAQSIQSAAWRMMGSPYLSKLTQYGSDGHARLVNSVFEPNGAPQSFTTGDLFDEVKGTILDPNVSDFPRPSNVPTPPLYIVVTPPGINAREGWDLGYHSANWFKDASFTTQVVYFAWVGGPPDTSAGDRATVDYYTTVLSHELVEAISDPAASGMQVGGTYIPSGVHVNPGAQWALAGEHEIADYEPANLYKWRLASYDGVMVQAYWSQSDGAYVVPDGTAQQFTLQPQWNVSPYDAGAYALSVVGDQFGAGTNDTIAIDTNTVWLNNEAFAFETGLLTSIGVHGRGGNDVVNVYTTPDNVRTVVYGGTGNVTIDVHTTGINAPVSYLEANTYWGDNGATVRVRGNRSVVNVTGSTYNDTVVVGYQGAGSAGYLDYVQAQVNVTAVANLMIDDSNDARARSVVVSNSRVSGLAAANVYYVGVLGTLAIKGGAGGNTFDVTGTSAGSTSILGGSGDDTFYVRTTSAPLRVDGGGGGGYDRVIVGYRGAGNAGSMNGIAASVTVSNVSLLRLDASGDAYAPYQNDKTKVTGLSRGIIYYSGVSSLDILTGHYFLQGH